MATRKWFLIVLILIFLGLVFYSGSKIKTDEDFLSLFPRNENYEKYDFVLKNSAISNKIIVFVTASDTALHNKVGSLIQTADSFVDIIETNHTNQISDIKYQISDDEMMSLYDFFYSNLPLFLTPDDYKVISERITDTAVERTLKSNFKTLVSPAGIALKKFLLKDPLGFTGLAMEKLNQFQLGDNFTIIQNRIFTNDKNSIFVFINTKNNSDTREMETLVEGVENLAANLTSSKVEVRFYGAPVVAAANAKQIKKDIYLTLSITILFIFILLAVYFRNYYVPFLLFLPVIVGAGISLIVIYFAYGEVSAISLGIGSVLLGIGIDFSLHFFTHYKSGGSVKSLLKAISLPVLISSITTAAAFLCLFIIQSKVFHDLGFFAAISILSTAIAALIVLPLVFKNEKFIRIQKSSFKFPDNIAKFNLENSKYLILSIILLSVFFFYTGKRTSFNENLMEMNFMTEELKENEDYLSSTADFVLSSVFAVSVGQTFNQALSESERVTQKLDKLKKNGEIADYFSINSLIISKSQQEQKIDFWNQFWDDRGDDLILTMKQKGQETGFRPETFHDFEELITKDFYSIPLVEFGKLSSLYFSDYIINDTLQSAIITTIKTTSEQKKSIHKSFASDKYSFLLDRQKISESLFNIVKTQFGWLILLSSIIVFVILLLAFGRIELAIISFFPIVLSWIWTIGIMGLFNIQFNIFNIIISTFIFGLGVDYSIFITRGLLLKLQYGADQVNVFKTSILLSGITTIVGTGVLIFAQHPAIKSIALVSVIGIASAIFITFTIQPFLFNFLTYYKGNKRALPVTLYNFFFSITSLVYFLIASLSSALIIIPIVKLLPLKDRTRKLIVHRTIHFFSKTVVYWNVHVPKILVNIDKNTFKQPTLAISNHQSALDLVFLLMLHPRIVILTNKMAWENPFYGSVIRFADFIYIDEGLDKVAAVVKQRMDEGYSVLIFPEGTRSPDCKIKRFHKGAFYIADKLNLEILPIMLHGACEAMNKKEFFLRRGMVHIKAFDKIDFNSGEWGADYSKYNKSVAKFYRKEIEKLNQDVNIPDRLKYNLINRYIFRGPVLEWYLRIKLQLENNYNLINTYIPRNAAITDIGCGYGFLSVMLALLTPDRQVFGFDYDDEKIETAKNCTKDLPNLSFETANALTFKIPESDVIILSDVLHYMNENNQKLLLNRCCQALNNEGVIIVRDADSDLKNRTIGTRITEFFSTKFGFNKAEEGLTFVSSKLLDEIAIKNNLKTERVDNTKLTSNILTILKK